jgi:hypothetical protein
MDELEHKERCPCCGDLLNSRQIYRHKADYERGFQLEDLAPDDVEMGSTIGAGEYPDVEHGVDQGMDCILLSLSQVFC